jgi:hypothetical protein
MNPLYEAAMELQSFLEARKWKFCFIGGLALIRWGEERTTRDVDATLMTGFEKDESFARSLLERFQGRQPDALEFALSRRVLLLKSGNGVGMDIALAGLPYEERVIANSSVFEFAPGACIRTCSAEDLVVLKAFASRPQDWVDIEGIIARQGPKLKTAYILKQLKPLADVKEAPEILDRVKKLLAAEKKRKPVSGRR